MVKKALAIAGAGAILLSMAGAVLGYCYGPYCYPMPSNDLNIGNFAMVTNRVCTKADSGDNSIGGKMVWGGTIRTGAAGATALVGNDVNSSVVGCDCIDGDIDIHNWASVYNGVKTKADSGDNRIGGMCVGGGSITTGAAGATSIVDNIVNFTVVGY